MPNQIKRRKLIRIILLNVIFFSLIFPQLTSAKSTCYNIVGYFPSWQGATADIDYSKYTHIVYSFAIPNADGSIGGVDNASKLIDLVSRGHANDVKVILSIGGWLDSSPSNTPFESITDSLKIARFVNACVGLINQYNLDGIDIDWEYPTTKTKWNNLIVPLADKIHKMNKLLSAAVSESANNNGGNYDNVTVLDLVNVMCYGNLSMATNAMNYWNSRKVPQNKIMLGVPFYDADNNSAEHIQKANLAISSAGGIMIWEISSPGDINAIYNTLGSVCFRDPRTTRLNIVSPKYSELFTDPANITINVNATDSDGIAKVEFYNNKIKLGTDSVIPYSFVWDNVKIGNYALVVTVTDSLGNKVSSSVPVSVQGKGPFNGKMAPIPGKIEAENFDYGGQGVAYNDLDAGNSGGVYRLNEDVDIESCNDLGGGYDIGWTNANEWLKYTVNVAKDGLYTLQARIAATTAGKTIHIEMDGVNVSGAIVITNTGAWNKWVTVSAPLQTITAGVKELKIVFDNGGVNLNYISLSQTDMSAIELNSVNPATVFPNPSSGVVTIQLNTPVNSDTFVTILNSMGVVVKSVSGKELADRQNIQIDLSGVAKGIYFVKINNTGNPIRKISIQ